MDTSIFKKIKQTASDILPKGSKAILFGSQARGEAHDGSDWDVLVIIDKDKLQSDDYDKFTYPLTTLGWDLNIDINPILYTKKEWESNSFTPFYHNVQKDGIALA